MKNDKGGVRSYAAMKRFLLWSFLFLTGLALGFALACFRRGSNSDPESSASASTPPRAPVLITVSAVVDGSDRFIFTRDNVWNEHGKWQGPQNVLFNGEPWTDLSMPPTGWAELAKDLDLTRATLMVRKGRDVIALEPTAEGFELYFADTPMGGAEYSATISIPRK